MSAVAEADNRNVGDRFEPVGDFGKPREAVEQIALVGVAGDDHARIGAEPGQQHLDLAVGAILRFVDDDKRVVQGAPAHIGDWCDFDRPLADQLLEPLAAEAFVQRVVERPQIGGKLGVHVPRQVAEAFTGLDCRAGQHDARHRPRDQRIDRGADREIGLAGSGGTECDRQIVRHDRRHQSALAFALRADFATPALLAIAIDHGRRGIAGFGKMDDRTRVRPALSHHPLPQQQSTFCNPTTN